MQPCQAYLEDGGMDESAVKQPGESSKVLDVRGLKAPDNILAVLEKATEMQAKSEVEFVIDSSPLQLYDLLQQRGYMLDLKPMSDGTFVGRAWPRDIKALSH